MIRSPVNRRVVVVRQKRPQQRERKSEGKKTVVADLPDQRSVDEEVAAAVVVILCMVKEIDREWAVVRGNHTVEPMISQRVTIRSELKTVASSESLLESKRAGEGE